MTNLPEVGCLSKKLLAKICLRVQCDIGKPRNMFALCLYTSFAALSVSKQVCGIRWMSFPRAHCSSVEQLCCCFFLLRVLFSACYEGRDRIFFLLNIFISLLQICIHFICCLFNEYLSIMQNRKNLCPEMELKYIKLNLLRVCGG